MKQRETVIGFTHDWPITIKKRYLLRNSDFKGFVDTKPLYIHICLTIEPVCYRRMV